MYLPNTYIEAEKPLPLHQERLFCVCRTIHRNKERRFISITVPYILYFLLWLRQLNETTIECNFPESGLNRIL